jgi:hypothetical protein
MGSIAHFAALAHLLRTRPPEQRKRRSANGEDQYPRSASNRTASSPPAKACRISDSAAPGSETAPRRPELYDQATKLKTFFGKAAVTPIEIKAD